ncbi:secreted protein [Histoplasma capsulatum]|uniref:Secreted protein n=1 Tax=Ajellomyces capsulatus TaxID=5037 RepID=A0A8A1MBU2_AJECA|nr:secreted protein [Histoplasma capsulatum]
MSSNAQIHEETWKLMTKLTVIGGDDQHIEEYIIVFKTDHPEVVLPKRSAALCALPPAVAEFENITVDDYKLKGSDYSGIIKDLDKALPIKSVKQVLAKTNHNNPDSSPGVKDKLSAFTWEDIDGYDDDQLASLPSHEPQGDLTKGAAHFHDSFNVARLDRLFTIH